MSWAGRPFSWKLTAPWCWPMPGTAVDMDRFRRQLARQGEGEHLAELDGPAIADLEPDLAGRFSTGLYLEGEGQLDPKRLLPGLSRYLQDRGIEIHFDCVVETPDDRHVSVNGTRRAFDWVIDCRGLAARDRIPALARGQGRGGPDPHKGGDAQPHGAPDASPLSALYRATSGPSFPDRGHLDRGGGLYGSPCALPLELLSAAYSLHPAFGEAEIVSLEAHCRPALPHNQPRIRIADGVMRVNGLYRHGFLMAPALARRVAGFIRRWCRFQPTFRAL